MRPTRSRRLLPRLRSGAVRATAGATIDVQDVAIGERVKLAATKRLWNVKARSDRFIVLTQPFNPKRSFIYTVIDLKYGIRGPHNSYGHPVTNDEQATKVVEALEAGAIQISRRRQVTLDVEWVIES